MENCHLDNNIDDPSYINIRKLACDLIEPYKNDIQHFGKWNLKLWMIIILIIIFIFYHLYNNFAKVPYQKRNI
jgi:hypothetical protein